MLELNAVPFGRYRTRTTPYFDTLARDPTIEAVMDLPTISMFPAGPTDGDMRQVVLVHVANGRYNYYQTLHGKKTTLGYTTSLAVTAMHDQRLEALSNLYLLFLREENRAFPVKVQDLGVDLVLHYRTLREVRPKDRSIDGKTLWLPFCFTPRILMEVRQLGEYQDVAYDDEMWGKIRTRFVRVFGEPVYEDAELMAFRPPE
jgi:hypothetical protein